MLAPVVAHTAAFEPVAGSVPHTNFKVGDTVTVPTPTSSGTSLRVVSLSVTETQTDYDYAVELGSINRSRDERMMQQLRKTGPAGLDWSSSANVQRAPDAGLGPEGATRLSPASTARIALNDLSDVANVGTGAIADGSVLAWDASLGVNGMWDPSSGVTAGSIPTGMVVAFPRDTPVDGFLFCDGSAVVEATHPDLYAYLGGGTLPDYRDRVLIGAGALYDFADTGGSADAVVVDHYHTVDANNTTAEGSGLGLTVQTAFADRVLVSGTVSDMTTSVAGVSGTGANLPPFLAAFYFIKT